MRTYVRVNPRPYSPRIELDGALEQGNLRYAIALAAEVGEDSSRPLDLDTALRFLPLVAAKQPEHFDAWALRWLVRWIEQTAEATIGRAAEVACALADSATAPMALDSVRRAI
jgi:hypothetical protein